MGSGVPRRGGAAAAMADGAGGAGDEENCRAPLVVHPAPDQLRAYLGLRRRSGDRAPRPRRLSSSWPSYFEASQPSPVPAEKAGPSRNLRTSCARCLLFLARIAILLAISSALLARLSRIRHAEIFPFGRAPPLLEGRGVGACALSVTAAVYWTASLALPEAVLWIVLSWIGRSLARRAGGGKRAPLTDAAIVPLLLTLLVVSAFIVATCTLETATLWYARRSAPWDLAYDIWNNWAAYRGMGESKRGELVIVAGCEMGGAVAVMAGQWVGAGWLRRFAKQLRIQRKYRVRVVRWEVHEPRRHRSFCSPSRRSRVFHVTKRDRMWQRAVVALAFFTSMVRFRPDEPYSYASRSTYLEAPVEISASIVQGRRQMVAEATKKRSMEKPREGVSLPVPAPSTGNYATEKQSKEKSSEDASLPVPVQHSDDGSLKNVVVIFLESARADLSPFDHSTAWAKEKILPSVLEEASKAAREGKPNILTPFYSALTRNETSSLYLPIKSTSGVTLKSVLATLCGVYPYPQDYTYRERTNGLYHECLPHLMAERGASSKFFLPMVTGFDDQDVLVDKMGFAEGIYGKEQYEEAHGLTLDKDPCEFRPEKPRRRCLRGPRRIMFEFQHNANYFGYEDNIMLDPMMEWVDDKVAANLPFFLAYEVGITHHPFDSPPHWKHTKKYSDFKLVDGFLNAAAYLDDFLASLLGEFESRNLAKDTLFVLVGDHGVALGDRGVDNLMNQDWPGAFDVGLTFHTSNPTAAKRLRKAAEERRHLSKGAYYGSIDVLPTVLDLLDLPDAASSGEGRSLLRAPFDGRSLSLSFINPGSDLVLRERNWVCVTSDKGLGRPTLYDLSVDPEQERPIRLGSSEKEDRFSALRRWGEIAVRFLRQLRRDLDAAYETGERCDNCTLSVLASSDSLSQWHGIETELASE